MTGKYSGLRTLTFLLLLTVFTSSILYAHDTIKIGVLANRGEEKSQQAWRETADYLNLKLPDYNFEFTSLTFNKMEAAVSQGEIDFLICNPANYILYRERYGLKQVATLQKRYKEKLYKTYGSVFFTRKDNHGIRLLIDLKGKKVGAVDQLSMGGCLLSRELLQTRGLDLLEDAKTVVYTHNHDEVVYSVLNGNVDIGIVRTGIIEEMVDKGEIKLDDVKVIHSQSYTGFPFLVSTDLIPEWPLAKLPHFPNEIALEIVRELFDLDVQSAQGKLTSNYGWTLPVDYSLVIDKLKNIQAPPFEKYEHSLKDKLSNDWYFFLLLFGLVVIFTLLAIFARYLQNQLNIQKINKDGQNVLNQRFKANDSPFFNDKKSFSALCTQKKYELKEFWSLNYLKWFLIVAFGYALSVNFGLLFSIQDTGNTAIWFAAGIGFLAVYALGYRIWPAIFLGAFIVNIVAVDIYEVRMFGSARMYLAIINSSINTLEAVIGVYIIRRIFHRTPLFSTIRSTVSFIILVAFFISLIAAVFGSIAFTTIGNNGHFYGILLTWWLSDAAGLLLIVPIVLSWKKSELSSSKIKQISLLIVFSILLTVVGLFIFQAGYHLAYLFLPFSFILRTV